MGGRSCKACCKKSKKGTDSSTNIVEEVGRPLFNATNVGELQDAPTSAFSDTMPECTECEMEERTGRVPSELEINEIIELEPEYSRDAKSRTPSPSQKQPEEPTSEFQRRVHRPLTLGNYESQVPGGQARFKGSGRHSHMQYREPPQLLRPPPITQGTLPATQNPVKRASPNLYKKDHLSHIAFSKEGKVDLRQTLHETGDRLVMVMFYENECEHCEAMRMIYEEFVIKYPEILFLEANVAYNERSINALKIKFLPTFIVFRNHIEVGRVMTVDAEEVEEMIHLNYPTHLFEGTLRLTP